MRGTESTRAPAEWQSSDPLDPAAWIPLVELALEGFGYAETIDARVRNLRNDLADEVLLDDIGRACVPRSVAREMFAERAQKQLRAKAREAEQQAKLAANDPMAAVHAHVRALQQRETTGDPLADIKRDDFEADWEKAAARRNEMAESERTGQLKYHSVREQEQD